MLFMLIFEMLDGDPFNEGIDAAKAGKGIEECLYVPFSEGEDEWIKGWRTIYDSSLNESILEETMSSDDFYLRYGWIFESKKKGVYQGKTVTLDSPTRGDVKRFKVYVDSGKKDKDGNTVAKKVNFGSEKGSKLRVRKNDPEARKSFAARHKCDTANDKTTARYWSCRGATSSSDAKYW